MARIHLRKFNTLFICTLGAIFAACGGKPPGSENTAQEAAAPSLTGEEKTVSQTKPEHVLEKIPALESELMVPENYGGAWHRRLRFKEAKGRSDLILEKWVGTKESGGWTHVGVTDSEGWAQDENIQLPTRYRVGRKIESGDFEGVRDQVLVGALKSNRQYKAYRVVVPEDFYIRQHTLQIEAEIFLVNGAVRGFYPDEGLDGEPAGTLTVNAGQVIGEGFMNLSGSPGRDGTAGRDGSPGQDQSCKNFTQDLSNGRDGGAAVAGRAGSGGGKIMVFSNEWKSEKFKAKGGPGGLAAAGGKGGRSGKRNHICGMHDWDRWCSGVRFRIPNCENLDTRGTDGRPGRDVSAQPAGPDGTILFFKRNVDPKAGRT